ncbi:MAG: VaFE repeat-containing surface-anchored protein, partial [Oscillospiraceae bacterium]
SFEESMPSSTQIRFTPKSPDGTIDLEFIFDASLLDGAKTVVFEELYDPNLFAEDSLVAIHKDDTDEGQSIYFPEIGIYISSEYEYKKHNNVK